MTIFQSLTLEDTVQDKNTADGAIIAVFALLVSMLTMEINSFRLVLFRNWILREKGRGCVRKQSGQSSRGLVDGDVSEKNSNDAVMDINCQNAQTGSESDTLLSSKSVSSRDDFQDNTNVISRQLKSQHQLLSHSYSQIRRTTLITILFWIILYLTMAMGVSIHTRGLEEKVAVVIGGASKIMASLMFFIVSVKIPLWLGIYHQGSILLVRHSSPYSQNLPNLNLNAPTHDSILQKYVRRGVSFHFAKFYVILMPFYCGRSISTVLFSMIIGVILGFLLMWFVFKMHKKYSQYRSTVAISTVLLFMIGSLFTFVRGMAWIQVVWRQYKFADESILLIISFFSWLVLLISVHASFLWHTFRVENETRFEAGSGSNAPIENRELWLGRKVSIQYRMLDPSIVFKGGLLDPSEIDNLDSESILQREVIGQKSVLVEMVANDLLEQEATTTSTNGTSEERGLSSISHTAINCTMTSIEVPPTNRHSGCHEGLTSYSQKYKQRQLLWKIIAWTKISIITLAYIVFLYFVIICIGATAQVKNTRAKLAYVHESIYTNMNEGPVCAFDNRGPESNITTFPDADAAHDQGFLILHCGACGACSSWENLILEWSTRDTISELANVCAERGLFGGNNAITECLIHPDIGWEASCAKCWMEDIVCVRENCAFVFLQSQMINNVGDFDVGPDDVTSATCEEANCEAGNPGHFVKCSGATRRRMNITSSIARPGEQMCAIVDVHDWDDLFFGSGVV